MKKTISLLLLATLLVSAAACGQNPETTTAAKTTASNPKATTQKPVVTDDPDTEPFINPDTFEFPDDDMDLFIPYGKAVIDGVKDEVWSSAGTVALETTKKDAPAETTKVTASALWDESAIYFLFEITDEDIFQEGNNIGDYNYDGIYLYINEDLDNTITNMSDYTGGIYQFALINKDLELLPRRGDTDLPINAQSAYSMTDTGMIIEFCYTFCTAKLEKGTTICVDYQYNDAGAAIATRKGALSWYSSQDGSGDSSLWGLARLLGKGESAPEQ